MSIKKSKIPLKICILGEGGVGKTTLTKRIVTGTFDASTKMTIGVDFVVWNTEVMDPLAPEDVDDVDLLEIAAQMWDFAGEQRFRFMLPRYCMGADGGILCYDLSRFSTTRYIDEWFGIWKENAPENAPLILVGTKADLMEDPNSLNMALENTREMAERLGIEKWYVISSKTGKDIHILANDIIVQSYTYHETQKPQKK